MNYEEAKEQGFRYVTRNPLGGECVHKTKPKRVGGYWESPGWRYIQGGTACLEKNVIMSINIAIERQNQQIKPRHEQRNRRKRKQPENVPDGECVKRAALNLMQHTEGLAIVVIFVGLSASVEIMLNGRKSSQKHSEGLQLVSTAANNSAGVGII